MIEWYKKVVFENYANFNGRARRSEYWYFTLANLIIALVLMVIDRTTGMTYGVASSGILGSIYSLLVFIPGITAMVRRLHDVGKSGWFFFINLIPIIGWIWFFVLMVTAGENGTNNYGPDPKNNFEEINEIGVAEL